MIGLEYYVCVFNLLSYSIGWFVQQNLQFIFFKVFLLFHLLLQTNSIQCTEETNNSI